MVAYSYDLSAQEAGASEFQARKDHLMKRHCLNRLENINNKKLISRSRVFSKTVKI